jgi:hypothetical protein
MLMKALITTSVLLLFFCVFAGVASASPADHSACTPKFGPTPPWLGGDAAYSIPLPDGRDVWIFGDTLYGNKRAVHGNNPEMVNNTIGISTCKDGNWDIKYTIRRGADGKFVSFFAPQHPKTWYWALDGVYYKGDLWVTLLCERAVPNSNSFALGFEACGADLAHITGVSDPNPENWKIQYFDLVPDGVKSYPTATAVVHDEYIYIFSVNDFGERALVATRIPVSGLNDPKKNLEYLSADGSWKPGFDPKNAKPVMAKGTSELSIRYHPELKKWVAVMMAPEWPTDKILFRTADDLLGPWTDGEVIYRFPEMQKSTPDYDPDVFCYAAKEHPEFEKGDLVFTYVCNAAKPAKLIPLSHIYYPQTVRKPMPTVK